MRFAQCHGRTPFGNLKAMLARGFPVRTLPKVRGKMAPGILTYNLKRVLNIFANGKNR
jgi:hypothetical protein